MASIFIDKGARLYKPVGCSIWHLDLRHAAQRQRLSLNTQSKEHALTVARQLTQDALSNAWGVAIPREITFEEFLDLYKAHAKVHNAPGTVRLNLEALKRFRVHIATIAPHKQSLRLSDVSPEWIESFKRARLSNGASPTTVHRNLGTLSVFFNLALRQNYLRYNPMKQVPPVPVVKNRIPKTLDRDQINALIAAAESPVPLVGRGGKGQGNTRPRTTPLADAIVFALNTGARLGEMLYLEWNDVDLDAEMVSFRCKAEHMLKDRAERRVRANEAVLAILRRRKLAAAGVRWVFPSAVGGTLERANAFRELKIAAKRAGVPGANFKILRATFATMCAKKIPPFVLKEVMGHSSIRTTETFYVGNAGGGDWTPPLVGRSG